MDAFLHLPAEKQQTVLDAAMAVFAKSGYKKASVQDIAAAAGISKAAVFHYFGSKRALYQHLLAHAGQTIRAAFAGALNPADTDFFERVRQSARVKAAVMQRHPAMLAFVAGAYFEADAEVADVVRAMREEGGAVRQQLAVEGADLAKFKPDVDPQLVLRILTRYSEGFVGFGAAGEAFSVADMMREFEAALDLMRRHFYKEEYL